ncbi:MAG: hypothetical protein NWE80_03795 [Candidatus Bathyarchaeota archaeon]|nr:hypothetical protein [Candidatus Bathyarchaeota archaeon]
MGNKASYTESHQIKSYRIEAKKLRKSIRRFGYVKFTAKHKIEKAKRTSPRIMALFIKFIFPNFAFTEEAFLFAISHSVEADLLV